MASHLFTKRFAKIAPRAPTSSLSAAITSPFHHLSLWSIASSSNNGRCAERLNLQTMAAIARHAGQFKITPPSLSPSPIAFRTSPTVPELKVTGDSHFFKLGELGPPIRHSTFAQIASSHDGSFTFLSHRLSSFAPFDLFHPKFRLTFHIIQQLSICDYSDQQQPYLSPFDPLSSPLVHFSFNTFVPLYSRPSLSPSISSNHQKKRTTQHLNDKFKVMLQVTQVARPTCADRHRVNASGARTSAACIGVRIGVRHRPTHFQTAQTCARQRRPHLIKTRPLIEHSSAQ